MPRSRASCLEVASAHPVFQRAENVLHRSSSHAHGIGPAVEPGLHGLDHLFMLPSFDTPLDAGGAVRLYSAAGATGWRGIAMKRQPMFEAGEASGQGFAGGAAIGISVGLVDEVLLAEAPLGLGA